MKFSLSPFLLLLIATGCSAPMHTSLGECEGEYVGISDISVVVTGVESDLLSNQATADGYKAAYLYMLDSYINNGSVADSIIHGGFEDRGLEPWTFVFQVCNTCMVRTLYTDNSPEFASTYLLLMSKLEAKGYADIELIREITVAIPDNQFEHPEFRLPILTYLAVNGW